ncbi:cystathionine beta-lyase, putative [Talaromyces stipitatus ATCC 10500]|uniref:Cystathionine beta-lyase, putative n=1 Tax=Talaromyces stipitatus (strain ATCC 10500 / CBS 375.48 / QM 6759 / NRRL 1006) TaxID=441959 RepID=B8MG26_TALSN|nr:cystathionine beta-lyase, putative [Talaromyces stipitatus ATCC 10500]EED15893.1 cystathionine beta-lyase, putative [Talaromyces stipitatus ATCC 10500]
MAQQVGDPLPPGDYFGVSVYLPTWKDTLAWAQRDPEFLATLKTGYPRFFIPRVVLELATRVLERTQIPFTEPQFAILTATYRAAECCRSYFAKVGNHDSQVICFRFSGEITVLKEGGGGGNIPSDDTPDKQLYAITYPERWASEGKAFWQHTGSGITSRCAVYWLEHAPFLENRQIYTEKTPANLPLEEGNKAVISMRQRIAESVSSQSLLVQIDDVTLYPAGMSAISNISLSIRSLFDRQDGIHRVAVFGFLYVDTFKVLGKIHSMDCTLYGHGTTENLDALENDLEKGLVIDALYTEFPGNPLLRSPDLERIHQLAQKHGFVVVVDDTVTTSVNLALFPYCDVICTSLTKMFSGACNVMGGSIVLNSQSPWFSRLESAMLKHKPEPYFSLDAIVMERNSRDFTERVLKASANADIIVDMLRGHPSVDEIFYPKGSSSQNLYDKFRRSEGGYGFLVSIRFVTPEAAIAFHDALDVAKGPSLGTNFTLCCAYTLLAHYSELEWAAEYGVVEHLVRISVGIESQDLLRNIVDRALAAAENALSVLNGS